MNIEEVNLTKAKDICNGRNENSSIVVIYFDTYFLAFPMQHDVSIF